MFTHVLRRFFPSAVAITLLSLMVYVVAQQGYRMAGNDPQEQLASEIAARISAGEKPSAVVSATAIDISKNEGVFTVIYDNTGKALIGNVALDGTSVSIPSGAVGFAIEHGMNRVTWQPKAGVREAVVIKNINAAQPNPAMAVAVGRSLHEAERRVSSLGIGVAFGWVVTLLLTFLAVAVGERREKA